MITSHYFSLMLIDDEGMLHSNNISLGQHTDIISFLLQVPNVLSPLYKSNKYNCDDSLHHRYVLNEHLK